MNFLYTGTICEGMFGNNPMQTKATLHPEAHIRLRVLIFSAKAEPLSNKRHHSCHVKWNLEPDLQWGQKCGNSRTGSSWKFGQRSNHQTAWKYAVKLWGNHADGQTDKSTRLKKKNLGCSFIQHNPARNPCTHKSMRMVWGYIAHAVTGRRSPSRGLAPHGGEEKGFKVRHRTNTHTGERISECVCWWFVYVGSYWRRSIFNLWSVLFTFLLFPPSWLCMLHMCGTVDMLSGLLVFPNYTILTSVFHCMSWIMYLLTCFCCSTASQTYRTCATRVCFCMSVNF